MSLSDHAGGAKDAESILKALEPWRNARRRAAWLPEVKNGPGLGTAHVTRCPTHPEVLALGWACG